jgi:hypothetical protein
MYNWVKTVYVGLNYGLAGNVTFRPVLSRNGVVYPVISPYTEGNPHKEWKFAVFTGKVVYSGIKAGKSYLSATKF